ncbi:MAG: SDR family oxidoreductase [Candidatus Binatia bacterium]
MDLGLNGRVAIVAGASKGLGKAVAAGLAREGASVVICARGRESLREAARSIAEQYKVPALPIVADLTNVQDVEKVVEGAIKKFSRVDILLNNAGGPPPKSFEDSRREDWERSLNLNFLSGLRLIQLVLPSMKAQKWGRIINILSSGVKQPIDGLIQSNAARAAMAGAAKTLSREVAPYGILVNNVCPGRIQTERLDEVDAATSKRRGTSLEEVRRDSYRDIPLARYGRPEEFANAVVFLASECASYITGSTIQVDGGYIRSLW